MQVFDISYWCAPIIYKGTTDEIGKCALTAALPKVWAREAVNSLSHSWRFGRDHPTCCKYPARRRRGGGRSVRAGWRSPLLSLAGQLSRSGLWPLRGVRRSARKSPTGPGWWWGAFGSGLDPRDRSSHLISPSYLTIGDQKHNICFQAFSISTLLFISFVFPVIPKRYDPSDN